MDFSFQYRLFVVLAPLVAATLGGIFLYLWRWRPSPEARRLRWLLVLVSGWLLCDTLLIVAPTPAATIFWGKVAYPFITLTPVAWLAFALCYIDRPRWLAPRRFAVFLAIPLITSGLMVTNEAHYLIWHSYKFIPSNGFLALDVDRGPWFWVHIIFSYGLILAGALLILSRALKSFTLYRWQSFWLIGGVLAALLFNALYILRPIPGWTKDYTPLSFALGMIAFAIGIARHRLFALQPLAREAMVDSMSDAMLAVDRHGQVIDLNPEAAVLLQQPAERVIGTNVARLGSPWPNIVSDQQQREIGLQQGGTERRFDLRVSPLLNRQQAQRGWLIVLRDVTERSRAEAMLRQRTRELQKRNEDLDAFSHTVAHDLKNPLNVITGYAELLNTHFLEDEQAVAFGREIINTGQKMADIIDALLLLASVSTPTEIETGPLPMAQIVDAVLERLRPQIVERNATVSVPEQWPVAAGYPAWIEAVWANYLSNALKYGGKPPRIELGATAAQHSGQIRFWVRDKGPGIPEAEQEKLFRLFSRLSTGGEEGHGLGLSIVERIIAKLGGDVGVDSSPGQGSTFWFTLPHAPRPVHTANNEIT